MQKQRPSGAVLMHTDADYRAAVGVRVITSTLATMQLRAKQRVVRKCGSADTYLCIQAKCVLMHIAIERTQLEVPWPISLNMSPR